MNFQPHIVRIATLPIASLLLIIAAALSPVRAAVSQAESEAERQVLKQIHEDRGVGSAKFLYYADRNFIAELEV